MNTLTRLSKVRANFAAERDYLHDNEFQRQARAVWACAIREIDGLITAEVEDNKRNKKGTYFRIVNSKGEQIGALLEDFWEADKKINEMAKDKRGYWKRYVIETLALQVVASNG